MITWVLAGSVIAEEFRLFSEPSVDTKAHAVGHAEPVIADQPPAPVRLSLRFDGALRGPSGRVVWINGAPWRGGRWHGLRITLLETVVPQLLLRHPGGHQWLLRPGDSLSISIESAS